MEGYEESLFLMHNIHVCLTQRSFIPLGGIQDDSFLIATHSRNRKRFYQDKGAASSYSTRKVSRSEHAAAVCCPGMTRQLPQSELRWRGTGISLQGIPASLKSFSARMTWALVGKRIERKGDRFIFYDA